MSTIERLRKDASELVRLSQLTDSENVKRILSVEADKLKKVADQEEKLAVQPAASSGKALRSTAYTTKIVNYAWDQSDKFIKLYVTLVGAQTFPEENFVADLRKKSLEFQATGPDKRTHVLTIKALLEEIVPSESYHKVKTDMIVLYLKKARTNHWGCVTASEKKAKEPKAPQFDKDEDPSQGLMSLMKQMYQDGDDDMKRTIAKAWTEARDKKSPEDMMP